MFQQIFLVGLGGGLGSIIRFLVSKFTVDKWTYLSLPLGTFIVNVIGCFLIGILIGLSYKTNYLTENLRALLIAGFCGGFTTFSAFSLENFLMYQSGNFKGLILYTLMSVLIGFSAVWAGMTFTK